jgi:hypothetical protein
MIIELQRCVEFSGLECQFVDSSDAKMICSHRQEMFLEAGGDPEQLQVMTQHFRA